MSSPYNSQPTKATKLPDKAPDKNTLITMLKLLRQYNLRGTEEQLKKEININDLGIDPNDSEIGDLLSAYKSEGDPNLYEDAYQDLKKFIENALDVYKVRCYYVQSKLLVATFLRWKSFREEGESILNDINRIQFIRSTLSQEEEEEYNLNVEGRSTLVVNSWNYKKVPILCSKN